MLLVAGNDKMLTRKRRRELAMKDAVPAAGGGSGTAANAAVVSPGTVNKS